MDGFRGRKGEKKGGVVSSRRPGVVGGGGGYVCHSPPSLVDSGEDH